MKSPKQALIDDGFPGVKPGKGRLSKAAIERCKELAASGVAISGYAVSSATAAAPATVEKVKATNVKEVVNPAPLRYNEGEWKAVSKVPVYGKTEFSMREICTFCGVSLVGHRCEEPRVLGVRVDVVPR